MPFLERLNAAWQSFYGSPLVLAVQSIAALALAQFCAIMTRHQSKRFVIGVGAATACVFLYKCFVLVAYYYKVLLVQWRISVANSPWMCLVVVARGFVAIFLIRVFVYVSFLLEEQKDLDAWAVGFFLSSCLHVICVTKLLVIPDYLCLSDSLLCVGILIAGKLDHKHGIEEACRIQATVNGTTVPINGVTVPINGTAIAIQVMGSAGFLNHIARTIFLYLAAVLLFCFRVTKIPYEAQEENRLGLNQQATRAETVVV